VPRWAAKLKADVDVARTRGIDPILSATLPPWHRGFDDIGERLQVFQETVVSDRRAGHLKQTAESGRVAVNAISSLEARLGGAMTRRIARAAEGEPGGYAYVISRMHPGGKYDALRLEYNATFATDDELGRSYERVRKAIESYFCGASLLFAITADMAATSRSLAIALNGMIVRSPTASAAFLAVYQERH
jgi:hypothetical protein